MSWQDDLQPASKRRSNVGGTQDGRWLAVGHPLGERWGGEGSMYHCTPGAARRRHEQQGRPHMGLQHRAEAGFTLSRTEREDGKWSQLILLALMPGNILIQQGAAP